MALPRRTPGAVPADAGLVHRLPLRVPVPAVRNVPATRGRAGRASASCPWAMPACRPSHSHRPTGPTPTQPPPPRVTFRRVVVSLWGPGRSLVLPFACCVGSLRFVGRCGRCSPPPQGSTRRTHTAPHPPQDPPGGAPSPVRAPWLRAGAGVEGPGGGLGPCDAPAKRCHSVARAVRCRCVMARAVRVPAPALPTCTEQHRRHAGVGGNWRAPGGGGGSIEPPPKERRVGGLGKGLS